MLEFVYMSLIGAVPFFITMLYTLLFKPKRKREKKLRCDKMLDGAYISKGCKEVDELCEELHSEKINKVGDTKDEVA